MLVICRGYLVCRCASILVGINGVLGQWGATMLDDPVWFPLAALTAPRRRHAKLTPSPKNTKCNHIFGKVGGQM